MSLLEGTKRNEIVAGFRYRHRHPDRVIETARVLALTRDPCGIPHVRYVVSYERRERVVLEEGPRILSLAAFASYYREHGQG